MNHSPDRKQRSAWRSVDMPPVHAEPDARCFVRNVHDGQLRVIVGTIPGEGLHLSVSHIFPPERKVKQGDPKGRYPSWDEIVDARRHHLPDDVGFAMHLPPADEFVALHQTTFHLHEELPPYHVRMGGKVWQVSLLTDGGEPVAMAEGGLAAVVEMKDAPPVDTTSREVPAGG